MVTIFAVLGGAVVVSVLTAYRADARLRRSVLMQEQDHAKIRELDQRLESLKTNVMKLVKPIRQNAEDIDLLDDDLMRIQSLVDELKKRERVPTPPALVKP